MNKVFVESLPKKKGIGKLSGTMVFDWINSVGKKVEFIYGDINGEVEIIEYNKKSQFLKISYLNKIYTIKTYHFIEAKLGRILNIITSEFKIRIGQEIKDKKRDLIITDRGKKAQRRSNAYVQYVKYYKYTCRKCGWTEGTINESDLLRGQGCSCCCVPSKVVVLGINSIWDTDKWMVPYIGEQCAKTHTRGSTEKVYPICPVCGRKRNKPMKISRIYELPSIGCSCGDGISYPEKIMFSVLEQINVKFETHYYPVWAKKKAYDFYLQDYNCIIETHGLQHYENSSGFIKRTLDEEQENDRIKKSLAINRGNIKKENYIVIDCRKSELDWIKNSIIESRMNNLFDLSKIDWNKCEEFSSNNLVKIACEYKKSNPNLTTTQIGELMNLNYQTVKKYLKKGNQLSWCHYDANEEIEKNFHTKGNKGINKRKVIFLNDGKVYLSMRKAADFYNCEYGKVTVVCQGKRKQTKGYRFMYYEEYKELNEDDISNKLNELKDTYRKRVICINNLKIFDSMTDAGMYCNRGKNGISKCCTGKAKSCGISEDGEPLGWMLYEDYLLLSKKEIEYRINILKESVIKKIICLNSLKVFGSALEAGNFYKCDDSCISKCCKGKAKYCGKSSEGEKLKWMYYDDYKNNENI